LFCPVILNFGILVLSQMEAAHQTNVPTGPTQNSAIGKLR